MDGLVQITEHLASLGVDLTTEAGGPKRATSLLSRRVPLAAPEAQLATLDAVPLAAAVDLGDELDGTVMYDDRRNAERGPRLD